ncbi:hypothetical protein DER44DRAFT_831595 [Fusarium oxysporum]|nr:hypothetical protein DER44DRAFT_831595 [Fusarium oxysporum]
MESFDLVQPPPPYTNEPFPPSPNEKFRHYYFFKKKDGSMPALVAFINKHRGDYKVELCDKETQLHIALPERDYMSLIYTNLHEIRRTLDAAMKKENLFYYWELDEKSELAQKESITERYNGKYQRRLEWDREFREMEAVKTKSIKALERQQFVRKFFSK